MHELRSEPAGGNAIGQDGGGDPAGLPKTNFVYLWGGYVLLARDVTKIQGIAHPKLRSTYETASLRAQVGYPPRRAAHGRALVYAGLSSQRRSRGSVLGLFAYASPCG